MIRSNHPQRAQAISLLTVATLIWGLSFLLLKGLGEVQAALIPGLDTWLNTACAVGPRFLIAAVVLLVWHRRIVGQLTRGECKQGLGLGLFSGLALLFQVNGLSYTDASTSAFLTQVYAVLIPLWVAFRTKRAPSRAILIACILVTAGAAILVRLDPRAFRLGRGEVETLISSLFFMAQILWLERPEFASNHPGRVSIVMFALLGFGFCGTAVALIPETASLLRLTTSDSWLGYTLALAGPCTLFCFTVMNAWQPKISASEAGLIYALEPVSASLLALFLPAWLSAWTGIQYANELITWNLVVGGVLIVAANLCVLPPSAVTGGKPPAAGA